MKWLGLGVNCQFMKYGRTIHKKCNQKILKEGPFFYFLGDGRWSFMDGHHNRLFSKALQDKKMLEGIGKQKHMRICCGRDYIKKNE